MMKTKSSYRISFVKLLPVALIFLLLVGCTADAHIPPTEQISPDGLSQDESVTLDSLTLVDDYPLYTMYYQGAYSHRLASTFGNQKSVGAVQPPLELPAKLPSWACSLFTALGDGDNLVYGRNFDWEFSPAVLLFTDPPDGYASVSMVDIAYLGFSEDIVKTLMDLPLVERSALLDAPFLPFDGMNERGLAVGMAAVPPGGMQPDPQKDTVDSLMLIRLILDNAATVGEALDILASYNINYGGGPPLHYLIADAFGDSVLVEFYQGEMVVIPNENSWHLATNFLLASVGESPQGLCERYDTLFEYLSESGGQITASEAMDFLQEVSQVNTEWSIVYHMNAGEVSLVMDRDFGEVYTFGMDFYGE